jgi:hypothetical protein
MRPVADLYRSMAEIKAQAKPIRAPNLPHPQLHNP